jgi:hypothetical protein
MKNILRILLTGALMLSCAAFADSHETGELDLGFMAIVGSFATPIIIVFVIFFFDYKNKQRMFNTVDKAIESGVEVPESVLATMEKPEKPGTALKKGLVWCGLGLGVLVAWSLFRNFSEASLGFIPLFLGIAYLISARLEPETDSNG